MCAGILYLSETIISLVFILLSGGLDTNWKETKVSVKPAFNLASLWGVITAVIIALYVMLIFKTTFLRALLIGSIIPSGGTTFQANDKLLVLVNKENINAVNKIFTNS